MQDLVLFWSDILENDLRGFADFRSRVAIDPNGREIIARWQLRDQDYKETFVIDKNGDFRWKNTRSPEKNTYSDFLASPQLAHFSQLSSAILRRFEPLKNYVPTKAVVDSQPAVEATQQESHNALFETVNRAAQSEIGKTQIIFIKGDAGAGKTTLLEYVTRMQAEKYQKGEDRYIFLYISAQGRALSNLRDAIAGETQDLRSSFTYHAVAPLTRHGLLIPVIDGFDELLGAAGYGDAFGSLKEFLEELQGNGVVIVSARSSFYDVEFVARQNEQATKSSYDLVPITLQRWGKSEIELYLSKVKGISELSNIDRRILSNLSDKDKNLLGKPFFASRFPEYVEALYNGTYDGSLVSFLMISYIRREAEKIVDRDAKPLVPEEGHRRFFEETADLMWATESRRLAPDDLKIIAELIADEVKLSSDATAQFVTKITSYAGFAMSHSGQFAFEHDVYFDYFLADALRRQLRGIVKQSYLDRGIIPEEVVSAALDDEELCQACFVKVLPLLDSNIRHENRRRNAGSLIAFASSMLGEVSNQCVNFVSFVNASLDEVKFKNVEFLNCSFRAVSMKGTRFSSCKALGCDAYSIVISEDTLFDLNGLKPGASLFSLRIVGQRDELFSPREMEEALQAVGGPVQISSKKNFMYSENAEQIIKLLQLLARKFARTNVLCVDGDPQSYVGVIVENGVWPTLYRMLRDHGLAREENRPTSGSKKTFLRPMVSMRDLLKVETEEKLPDDAIGAFWRALRNLP